MGAWNLTAGFVLLTVFLKIQASEAVPKGNASHGLQEMIFPDFRQKMPELTLEELQVLIAFNECAKKWLATIGDPCISQREVQSKSVRLFESYKGDVPLRELKKLAIQECQSGLTCSDGKCECKGIRPCDLSGNPKKNVDQNCEREGQAAVQITIRLRNAGSRVSDPGQYFQYTVLTAVILFVVAAN